jgi:hypothetical protein
MVQSKLGWTILRLSVIGYLLQVLVIIVWLLHESETEHIIPFDTNGLHVEVGQADLGASQAFVPDSPAVLVSSGPNRHLERLGAQLL